MSDDELNKHNRDKSWLHSDAYTRANPNSSQTPRTHIHQFGTLTDLLTNAGKLLGQSLIYFMLSSVFYIFLIPGPEAWGGDQAYLAVHEIVKLGFYTISVFLAVKVLDGSEIADLGLRYNRQSVYDFLAGLAIIFTIFSIHFVLSEGAGWIAIRGGAWQHLAFTGILGNILITFMIFGFVGWSEELLSRGFHLRIISKGLNRPLGVLLSSVFFSYMHRDNPGGANFGYLLFIFLTGLMLSFAYLRTGQLWLPIGLHTGWDFFGTVVFFGGSINGLKIFSLMDIVQLNYPTRNLMIEVLLVMAVFVLAYFYTINRKPEPLVW